MHRILPAVLVVFACRSAIAAEAPVDFNRDVRPILSNHCYACHGPDEKQRKADLRLDNFDGATGKSGGTIALVPKQPAKSELLKRIVSDDASEVMPPPKHGKKLSDAEVKTLKTWIEQGAKYAVHWSYVKPVRPAVPANAKHPVDAFIRARLAKDALSPSPEADRNTLIRRVSLDLTGLPPTWKEVEAFVNDKSTNAYEAMVDRLLAKPSCGEHFARMWLDLARYADSAGYADDPQRVIWAYRDYVIMSFNDNKRFDNFTIEQIAGDMLPNPTINQLVGTAFHRNTMTNNEGGTNDEEFRNVAVVDRVNTTLAVWMGTSMACAQCHTHKYDPITQKEYFQFFAFLNNTADADKKDESPVLELGDPALKAKRVELTKQIAEADKAAKEDPAMKPKADALKKELAAMPAAVTVPIQKELPEKSRRVTKIQHRGNFQDLGDEVTEGVPAAFHSVPKGEPLNRLTMAKWLVSSENPLTGRVIANRFWEEIFGSGLVRTSEEFGSQGELPSHPELLDWLAVEFVESGWDVKKLLKLYVTSETYKQSSKVTPQLLEKDPENRKYARGPRFRLSAEMVRDQALAVSGLLSPKMFGTPVRPVRPNSGLNAAFGGNLDWTASAGEDKFRRGIYTEWRRTSPYPSMVAFDAPSREACTLRRIRTNTPLQALVTLNDPVYIEAAQAFARLIAKQGESTPEKIEFAFRTALSRDPSEKELGRLVQLYSDAHDAYAKDLKKATEMATNPIGPLPKGALATELAAWTTVANVILNLDEMLMRR
jgi:mono/diheme cytochrome c family protein